MTKFGFPQHLPLRRDIHGIGQSKRERSATRRWVITAIDFDTHTRGYLRLSTWSGWYFTEELGAASFFTDVEAAAWVLDNGGGVDRFQIEEVP